MDKYQEDFEIEQDHQIATKGLVRKTIERKINKDLYQVQLYSEGNEQIQKNKMEQGNPEQDYQEVYDAPQTPQQEQKNVKKKLKNNFSLNFQVQPLSKLQSVLKMFPQNKEQLSFYDYDKIARLNNKIREQISLINIQIQSMLKKFIQNKNYRNNNKQEKNDESQIQSFQKHIQNNIKKQKTLQEELIKLMQIDENVKNQNYIQVVQRQIQTIKQKIKETFELQKKTQFKIGNISKKFNEKELQFVLKKKHQLKNLLQHTKTEVISNEQFIESLQIKLKDLLTKTNEKDIILKNFSAQLKQKKIQLNENKDIKIKFTQLDNKKRKLTQHILFLKYNLTNKIKKYSRDELISIQKQIEKLNQLINQCTNYLNKIENKHKMLKTSQKTIKSKSLSFLHKPSNNKKDYIYNQKLSIFLPDINKKMRLFNENQSQKNNKLMKISHQNAQIHKIFNDKNGISFHPIQFQIN